MKHYLQTVEEVFSEVNSTENGLSAAEAEKRLEANGKVTGLVLSGADQHTIVVDLIGENHLLNRQRQVGRRAEADARIERNVHVQRICARPALLERAGRHAQADGLLLGGLERKRKSLGLDAPRSAPSQVFRSTRRNSPVRSGASDTSSG